MENSTDAAWRARGRENSVAMESERKGTYSVAFLSRDI
jgi:hypothetical protein